MVDSPNCRLESKKKKKKEDLRDELGVLRWASYTRQTHESDRMIEGRGESEIIKERQSESDRPPRPIGHLALGFAWAGSRHDF